MLKNSGIFIYKPESIYKEPCLVTVNIKYLKSKS